MQYMPEDPQQAAQPVITCILELDPALKNILDPAHPFHAAISQALVDELAHLMRTLGIPGRPSVELQVLEEATPQFMNVRINGQPCPYPTYIYQRVYSYVKASLSGIQADYEAIWEWLRSLAQELSEPVGSEALDRHPLVEFLTGTCLEIVKTRPAVLLGLEQVEAIKRILPQPPAPLEAPTEEAKRDLWPETEWLHVVLTMVLKQNISLADTRTIALTLRSLQNSSQEETAEELITKLSADVVEIQLPQDLLRTFTTSYAGYRHDHLRNVRQKMMKTYGFNLPEMRFVLNENLKPNSFVCKINSLAMLPWIVVPDDALDYIEQMLMLNVSENRTCFVHRRAVEQWLAPYKQSSPLFFKLSSTRLPMYRITQVLRMLILEQLSVRNLILILERLLNYSYIVANAALPMTFDELFPVNLQEEHLPPDHHIYLESFIRIGLKREISNKYAGVPRQLYSYIFQSEPVIEQALSIFHEFDAEQRPVPPEAQPVVITSIGVRPVVQELVNASLLPSLPIIAYQELTPGLHIQLIGHLAI